MLAIVYDNIVLAVCAGMVREELHGVKVEIANELVIHPQIVALIPNFKCCLKKTVLSGQISGKDEFPDFGLIIQNEQGGSPAKRDGNLLAVA